MKFIIVLFAVVVAASAYPGVIPWAAPAANPWPAPAPWPAPVHPPAYVKVAPVPTYVKVAQQAPAVHHVVNIPQQPAIPPVHPQPLNIKVPHAQAVRIPLGGVKIVHPHLVGYEAYAPAAEPVVKVVKAAAHPWD